MSETTEKQQAEMAIKLSENVRKLIRDEIAKAFEDTYFWMDISYISREHMARAVCNCIATNVEFKAAVKQLMHD